MIGADEINKAFERHIGTGRHHQAIGFAGNMWLRREQLMVDSMVNARHARRRNAEILFDIALGAVGNDNQRVKLAGHFNLHI